MTKESEKGYNDINDTDQLTNAKSSKREHDYYLCDSAKDIAWIFLQLL